MTLCSNSSAGRPTSGFWASRPCKRCLWFPAPILLWSVIGSLRREYLDHLFYWNAGDLERKLELFRRYFNATRAHQGLGGDTPEEKAGGSAAPMARLTHY